MFPALTTVRLFVLTGWIGAAVSTTACLLPEVTSTADSVSMSDRQRSASLDAENAPAEATLSEPPATENNAPAGDGSAVPGVGGQSAAADASSSGGSGGGPGGTQAANGRSANDYACNGSALMQCRMGRSSCHVVAECTSPKLCDAANARCQPALCAPGSQLCEDNVLRTCDSDGTSYLDEPCGAKLCNQAEARCDVCAPGSSKCESDRVREVCRGDGTGYDQVICSENAPYCSNGHCGTCLVASDCPRAGACWRTFCREALCYSEGDPDGTGCTAEGGLAGHCVGGRCMRVRLVKTRIDSITC